MEKLVAESTRSTPFLLFDPSVAILELRGRSSPDNSVNFYNKLLESLELYCEKGEKQVIVNIAFEYFNSSTSKIIFDLFKKLSVINKKGNHVSVNWFFDEDDDDMLEAGEDYADLVDLDFQLCPSAA